jgi:magnesium transporter
VRVTPGSVNHKANDVRSAYPQTVADYVAKAVPIARLDDSVRAVRRRLLGRRFDDASHIFVIESDGQFVAAIEVADLLAADADKRINEVTNHKSYPTVPVETDREDAASVAIRSGISTLAVTDREGRFMGAVPADALMSILRDEHLEDLHHMVGILSRSEAAKEALTGPPHRRAFYRIPWLLIGMLGSAAATAIMAQFESALTAHIAIAFFIPAIVYLADAVGTQSEAVAVRGLSLAGAEIGPLLAGELGTGVLIGGMLGAIAFPLVWLGFGNMPLAATVSLALAAASSVATTTGFLLPWLFGRMGYDPALGSGPLGTVLQDVISLAIYFSIAALLIF